MTTVSDALTIIFRQINREMDAVWRYGIAQTAARMCRDLAKQHVDDPDVPAAPDGADGYAK